MLPTPWTPQGTFLQLVLATRAASAPPPALQPHTAVAAAVGHAPPVAAPRDTTAAPAPCDSAVGPRWVEQLTRAAACAASPHDGASSASPPPPPPPPQQQRDGTSCGVRVVTAVDVLSVARCGDGGGGGDGGGADGATPGAGPLRVALSNGEVLATDCVVAATGVSPSVEWRALHVFILFFTNFLTLLSRRAPSSWARTADGGLAVDASQRVRGSPATSRAFAAGDSATRDATFASAPHWHQMRLWGQARDAGRRAAASMLAACRPRPEAGGGYSRAAAGGRDAPHPLVDPSLELFTHATRFFGRRVVLLGRYNGQGLPEEGSEGGNGGGGGGGGGGGDGGGGGGCGGGGSDIVSYSRQEDPSPSHEGMFVRVTLFRGRVVGAVLIGDSAADLSETFEHLILDELDVSSIGPHLLDPDIDIEDFFD